MDAQHRLATYGTLAPGRSNQGWGATLGYPALVLDPDGPAVEVHLFESDDLPAHWPRLDTFEGPGYRRVTAAVHTAHGQLDAQLYALAISPPILG